LSDRSAGRIVRRGFLAVACALALVLPGAGALPLAAPSADGGPLGPAAARAAECEGDDCQGPPPAPDDPAPGTAVVEGPPNPPVRFPKSQNGKGKKKHKKHGKRRQGGQRHRSVGR
jgi:hypothetical protein